MTDTSLFNIAPTSLKLGAVLAYGANSTVLYKADLLQAGRKIQVGAYVVDTFK